MDCEIVRSEILVLLVEEDPETPVVILTSDESTLSRHLTLGRGAVSHLTKRRTSSLELRQALHEAVEISYQDHNTSGA
jgi:CheY-like chemotaxis protein